MAGGGAWEIDRAAFALFVAVHRREAAAITGVSYSSHGRAERGERVSAGHLLRLCLWIGANPYWFLTDPATGRRLAEPPDWPAPAFVPRETGGETAGGTDGGRG